MDVSNTSFDNVRACVREHQSSERKTEFVYNSQTFTKKQHLWTPANHSHSKTNTGLLAATGLTSPQLS